MPPFFVDAVFLPAPVPSAATQPRGAALQLRKCRIRSTIRCRSEAQHMPNEVNTAPAKKRKPPRKALQLKIFRRDGWLCCWCKKPVIFPAVMKYLQMELRSAGNREPLAYYHAHWTRNTAPLLDAVGAVIDHVEAFSTGGTCTEDNFCTACCKCNVLKGASPCGHVEPAQEAQTDKGQIWRAAGLGRVFTSVCPAGESLPIQADAG